MFKEKMRSRKCVIMQTIQKEKQKMKESVKAKIERKEKTLNMLEMR